MKIRTMIVAGCVAIGGLVAASVAAGVNAAGIAALAVASSIGVGWLIGRRVSRRLDELTRLSRAIGEGRLDEVSSLDASDELAPVGDAFQRLSGDIAALIEREKRLVNSLALGVFAVDRAGRITSANKTACELAGCDEDELVGAPVRALFSGEHAFLLSGAHETRLHPKSGELLPVVLSQARLSDGTGATVGEVWLCEDLRERRRLEARLNETEKLSVVGQLAYGVAHEINNPLAYVVANLEFARAELAGRADADVVAALDEAAEGSLRVRQIVRDLKAFARADEDQHTTAVLHEVLDTAVKLAGAELKHRARVERDFAAAPPVRGNEGRLTQLFLNLLVNAAQAIREGAVQDNTITVRIASDRRGWALVEIHDTGCGMTPEVKERVFEPFFTTKPIGVGTGLGLPICHGIVSALGGEIEVDSTPGEGSVLRVYLPPAPELAEPAAEAPASVRPAGKARVLVIDDDEMVGRAVRRMIAGDHEVELSTSGKDALARIERGDRFDVILCDLMMPEMTGMDLYERVQASHPRIGETMVFITGGAFTERSRAFAQTGVPVLDKPFDPRKLRQTIRSVVETRAA